MQFRSLPVDGVERRDAWTLHLVGEEGHELGRFFTRCEKVHGRSEFNVARDERGWQVRVRVTLALAVVWTECESAGTLRLALQCPLQASGHLSPPAVRVQERIVAAIPGF